ncbi:holin [Streptomyces sp. SLBN-118]|uniref:holin n=1 Tax=Streptomyces sp. SLBN-118 TaxID=2768454 RepID=UPI001C92BE0D
MAGSDGVLILPPVFRSDAFRSCPEHVHRRLLESHRGARRAHFAQSLVAILTAGATNLFDVEWQAAVATAGVATLLAVLTAIGAAEAGRPGPGLNETTERVATAPSTAATTAPATGTS